jgi:ribosomal protein S18 acetylase RimI-like enzyme
MTAKFLATETDRMGSTLEIYQYPTLDWSPAYPLFIKTYAELVENKLTAQATAWNKHSCGVVYAELDTKVIGAMAYDTAHPEFTESLWVTLWCVDPEYRRRGIVQILFKHFENIGRELGKTSVLAHTHLNNQIALESNYSVGLKPISYLMGKKLN